MKRSLLIVAACMVSILLVVPVFILALPIWLFVFLCGQLNDRVVSRGVARWDQVVQYDPDIGWKPRPFLKNVKYFDPVGDIGTVDTDGAGWPLELGIGESDVVVFGDSFAFGFGSTMSNAYYNGSRGLRVKPVAAPAFNMVQGLLLMRQYSEQLEGKLVFWFVCLENDLVENLKPYNSKNYPNPFVRNEPGTSDWRIESGHLKEKRWPYGQIANNSVFFADICTRSPYSERVYSSVRYLVGEAKQVCDTVAARLIVLTVPDKRQLTAAGIESLKKHLHEAAGFDEDYPDEMFRKICDEMNVAFIAGKTRLSIHDYKPRDPHWNKMGNRKIAGLISEYYGTEYAASTHSREAWLRPQASS